LPARKIAEEEFTLSDVWAGLDFTPPLLVELGDPRMLPVLSSPSGRPSAPVEVAVGG
jgi:hypothetical protein